MSDHGNLLGIPATLLPDDSDVRSALDGGTPAAEDRKSVV